MGIIQEERTRDSLREEVRALRKELQYGSMKGKEKQFKIPFSLKNKLNRSQKGNKIVVCYLTKDYKLEFKLVEIDNSNIILIGEKVFEFDPRAVFRMGRKWLVYIIREIDRRPISNRDYNKVRLRGDSTDSDEILLKAAMKAITVGKAKKNIAVILIVLAIIAIVIFVIASGAIK